MEQAPAADTERKYECQRANICVRLRLQCSNVFACVLYRGNRLQRMSLLLAALGRRLHCRPAVIAMTTGQLVRCCASVVELFADADCGPIGPEADVPRAVHDAIGAANAQSVETRMFGVERPGPPPFPLLFQRAAIAVPSCMPQDAMILAELHSRVRFPASFSRLVLQRCAFFGSGLNAADAVAVAEMALQAGMDPPASVLNRLKELALTHPPSPTAAPSGPAGMPTVTPSSAPPPTAISDGGVDVNGHVWRLIQLAELQGKTPIAVALRRDALTR